MILEMVRAVEKSISALLSLFVLIKSVLLILTI